MRGFPSASLPLQSQQCQLQLHQAVFETSPVLSVPCPFLVSCVYCCHGLLLPHLPFSPLSAISCSFPIPHNHLLILILFQSTGCIYNAEKSKNKLRGDEYKNEDSTVFSWSGFRCIIGNTKKDPSLHYVFFSYNLVFIVIRWVSGKNRGVFSALWNHSMRPSSLRKLGSKGGVWFTYSFLIFCKFMWSRGADFCSGGCFYRIKILQSSLLLMSKINGFLYSASIMLHFEDFINSIVCQISGLKIVGN